MAEISEHAVAMHIPGAPLFPDASLAWTYENTTRVFLAANHSIDWCKPGYLRVAFDAFDTLWVEHVRNAF